MTGESHAKNNFFNIKRSARMSGQKSMSQSGRFCCQNPDW